MNKNSYCTMYIVRHGLTDWNVLNKMQGHTDISLNSVGREQAKKVANKLKKINFEAVYSSDLSRAKETAEIIVAYRKLTIKLSKALRERHHGFFEGTTQEERKTKAELKKLIDHFYGLPFEKQWINAPHKTVEPYAKVAQRFISELRAIGVAHIGKNVLVVSHGGSMRILLIHLGVLKHEDYYKVALQNTGYIKLRSDGVDFFIDKVVGLIDNSKIKNLSRLSRAKADQKSK